MQAMVTSARWISALHSWLEMSLLHRIFHSNGNLICLTLLQGLQPTTNERREPFSRMPQVVIWFSSFTCALEGTMTTVDRSDVGEWGNTLY